MKKVLLAYYNGGEVTKVVKCAEKVFSKENFSIEKMEIVSLPNIDPRKQKKIEQWLKVKRSPKSVKQFDLIVLGTPIFAFSSVPAVNAFIRALPRADGKKVILFATGVGLPGSAIKKMKSLLSMKGAKVVASQAFLSIFEFDSKKTLEIEKFFADSLLSTQ